MSSYKLWELPREDYIYAGEEIGVDYVEGHVANKTERVIEMPWALSCIGDAERVLDVGNAYSERRWYEAIAKLNIKELHGFDKALVPARSKRWTRIYTQETGDMRYPLPYMNDYFDIILCVSTIEHLGYDNSMYFAESENFSVGAEDDKLGLENLMDVLKPGGRLVLTAPYGRWDGSFKGFRHYDRPRFKTLIRPYKIEEYQLFHFNGKGWRNSTEQECDDRRYGMYGFSAASGLVCVILTK